MKCPGSQMVPNDTPRGVTPYGTESCEKIRRMLGGSYRGVPLLDRNPGEDLEEDTEGDNEKTG